MERDFILGVIGGFSGAGASKPDRFLEIDRDDFAAVFARLSPRIPLGLGFCDELRLETWEDWHPDALITRVASLDTLLEARASASDPARMRSLIAESGVSIEEPTASAPAAQAQAPVSESDLLDDLLGGGGAGAPVRVTPFASDPTFARLLEAIASPHAERIDHAGVAAREDAIDREIGARLRAVLHHPAFQRREALWRSLRALVFGTETSESLRIRILDADVDRLRGQDAGPLTDQLHQRIVTEEKETLGGTPFDLLLVDAQVEGSPEADLPLLGHLARLAAAAQVPCLLAAGRGLWSDPDDEAVASFLAAAKALPGADRLGLCVTGMLARLPYGADSDPVDRFRFEELEDDPAAYLWGSAAFAVASAAAETMSETGALDAIARFARRGGLPFHPSGPGDEPVGPARVILTDSEIAKLRERGLLPVAGVRGRDEVVITSISSLTGAPLFR